MTQYPSYDKNMDYGQFMTKLRQPERANHPLTPVSMPFIIS